MLDKIKSMNLQVCYLLSVARKASSQNSDGNGSMLIEPKFVTIKFHFYDQLQRRQVILALLSLMTCDDNRDGG